MDRRQIEIRKRLEIMIFEKCGADEKLAKKMSGVFGPLGWVPSTRSLQARIKKARNNVDYQYLAFGMLLKGDTEKAREYLEKANELRPSESYDLLLNNLDKVQRIITYSKSQFDYLRMRLGIGIFDLYL